MFDQIITRKFNGTKIEHGLLFGSNTVLLIKGGQNATIAGYQNKYLQIAETIHQKYGATVCCAANPFDGKNSLDVTMELLDDIAMEREWDDVHVYYMGVSNGALLVAFYGYLYPQIQKALLVNMPIQARNYTYAIDGLSAMEADPLTLVYGELDHSCMYLPLLDPLLSNKKATLEVVPHQDHHFTFGMQAFKALPEQYLFSER